MREFKFRAWDENAKKMYDEIVLGSREWCIPLEVGSGRESILMQFTGLTDKNGKNIYEGDIVRRVYSDDEEYIDIIEDIRMDVPFIDIEEYPKSYLEVLGNIYEHKHLIKKAKE